MTLIDQDVDARLERRHFANMPPLARSRAPALGRAESSHSVAAGEGNHRRASALTGIPARYLVSFTWPIPAQQFERRDDGSAYYNNSRAANR